LVGREARPPRALELIVAGLHYAGDAVRDPNVPEPTKL
jgi:hypothetical protein